MSRPIGTKAGQFSGEEITRIDNICMNPRATSCEGCIFDGRKYEWNGQPWCKAEERIAKVLYDIRKAKGEAA